MSMGKKEPPPPVHIPIEPSGLNAQGTLHFSQGLLPNSSWLVLPANPLAHPHVPVAQIQIPKDIDILRMIETAHADLAMMTKLKRLQAVKGLDVRKISASTYMKVCGTDLLQFNRAVAYPNGQPSPAASSPNMSPRGSN